MSPEQAVGERQIDGRSDIYSLGVLGYQMLTGRVPFAAGNSMALLLKHVGEVPRPIAELRPEAPRVLREAIERALMKAPEDRWPTAGALREALMSSEPVGASWRAEPREPVRYASPRPDSRVPSPRRGTASADARADRPAASIATNGIILEPEHLAAFTPAQRDDIRLWGGRIHLFDRVKAIRTYAVITLGMWGLATTGVVVAFAEGAVPLVLSPIVPYLMTRKLRRRGQSLRQSGLKLRHVFLMLRARWVLPQAPSAPNERQLAKLASRDVLESPQGAAVRRAAEDRAAILAILASLPKPDRALLPDLVPTVNGLVERVALVAQAIHRMDQGIDARTIAELDARLADTDHGRETPESQQRLALLRRQRATFDDLAMRRGALARQLESAGLALGNLRLDLLKVRSSGVQSALSDVTSATQEARALSRDIGVVLDAVNEVRRL
jgi:serine/threonine-protein kinase